MNACGDTSSRGSIQNGDWCIGKVAWESNSGVELGPCECGLIQNRGNSSGKLVFSDILDGVRRVDEEKKSVENKSNVEWGSSVAISSRTISSD